MRPLILAPISLILAFATVSGRAQILMTPELQIWAGYDSNRYRDPDNEEADAFWEIVPALEVSWFASDTLETRARVQHSERMYLSSTNGQAGTTSGELGFSWLRDAWGIDVYAGGGLFRDSELPNDDVRWIHLAPTVRYTFPSGFQLSLDGYVSQNDYDSRLTFDGEDESGQYFSLKPGFQWPISMNVNLWGQTYIERFNVNEPVDEYNGYGAILGVDYNITPLLRFSGSIWGGIRDYPNEVPELVDSRTDKPIGVDLNLRYRMNEWLTFLASADWAQTPSTDSASEYSQWFVRAGVIIAQDISLSD